MVFREAFPGNPIQPGQQGTQRHPFRSLKKEKVSFASETNCSVMEWVKGFVLNKMSVDALKSEFQLNHRTKHSASQENHGAILHPLRHFTTNAFLLPNVAGIPCDSPLLPNAIPVQHFRCFQQLVLKAPP